MKCISKAFALPCEGRNVQAEDAQRLCAAMGKVVIRKGAVRTQPSRRNMLGMTVIFVEQRFAVHAAAVLLAIELALEHWPQQLNRKISPVSTGVLSAVLPQRIWFREAVFKLDHQVLTFALLALRVRNANNA